jgi:hypothetical protein
VVEHFLGKEEVEGSILSNGSCEGGVIKKKIRNKASFFLLFDLNFYLCTPLVL